MGTPAWILYNKDDGLVLGSKFGQTTKTEHLEWIAEIAETSTKNNSNSE